MNQRICRLAQRALTQSECFHCTDGDLKEILLTASADEKLRIIVEEYPHRMVIDEDSLIVGRHPRAMFWDLSQKDMVKGSWSAMMAPYTEYHNKAYMNAGNHLSADYETVLHHGMEGLLEQIRERKKKPCTSEQTAVLDEMAFSVQAILLWVQTHVQMLCREAQQAKTEQRRKELLEMAEICRRVPAKPAKSFREAVQSYFFTFLILPDGVGRLDQYLYPYYLADRERGVITEEQAREYIEELFIKIFAKHDGDGRSGQTHGAIGGYTVDGACGHNACTSLILQAITELPTWRPQISYRVTEKTTMDQLREVVEANHVRPDVIMFLNDDAIIKGLVKAGVSPEDAVEYSVSGCNETVITGRSQMGALQGHINMIHALETMLNDDALSAEIEDFDTFYRLYEEYLQKDLEVVFRQSYDRDVTMSQRWWPGQSALTRGCIENASLMFRGGAKYNYCTWCLTGLINLADSLSILRQMVFEDKRFTLAEFRQFLAANWQGYEKQRAYILNNGRYFGNDDDYVDSLVNRIGASVNAIAREHLPYRGGRYLFGTLTGYELAHVVLGEATGASADGRFASDPFCASVTAFPDADKSGLTAYLKSAAKIDAEWLASSVVVNATLDRALADSEEKRQRLTALLMTYFRLGGIQLQINYLSADELIRAQQQPDQYRNLRVRVTGFSGFFTTFDKNLQDELIERSRYAE